MAPQSKTKTNGRRTTKTSKSGKTTKSKNTRTRTTKMNGRKTKSTTKRNTKTTTKRGTKTTSKQNPKKTTKNTKNTKKEKKERKHRDINLHDKDILSDRIGFDIRISKVQNNLTNRIFNREAADAIKEIKEAKPLNHDLYKDEKDPNDEKKKIKKLVRRAGEEKHSFDDLDEDVLNYFHKAENDYMQDLEASEAKRKAEHEALIKSWQLWRKNPKAWKNHTVKGKKVNANKDPEEKFKKLESYRLYKEDPKAWANLTVNGKKINADKDPKVYFNPPPTEFRYDPKEIRDGFSIWRRAISLISRCRTKFNRRVAQKMTILMNRIAEQLIENSIYNTIAHKKRTINTKYALEESEGFEDRVPLARLIYNYDTYRNEVRRLNKPSPSEDEDEDDEPEMTEEELKEFEFRSKEFYGNLTDVRTAVMKRYESEHGSCGISGMNGKFREFLSRLLYEVIERFGRHLSYHIESNKIKTVTEAAYDDVLTHIFIHSGLDPEEMLEYTNERISKFDQYKLDRKEERKEGRKKEASKPSSRSKSSRSKSRNTKSVDEEERKESPEEKPKEDLEKSDSDDDSEISDSEDDDLYSEDDE